MRYFIASLLILILALTACRQTVNLVPAYPGDQPVMTAFLTPDSTLTVWLTLTIPALTPNELDTIPRIEDAEVWILRDGDTLEALPHAGDGYYRSPQGLPAEAGGSYRFVALLTNGDTLTHLPVEVPPAVPLRLLGYEPEGFRFGNGQVTDLLRIAFDDPAGAGEYYQGQVRPLEAPREFINVFNLASQESQPEGCQPYAGLFPDLCFDGQRQEWGFRVEPTYFDDSLRQQVRADSLLVSLNTWSESYFLMTQSDPRGQDGIEQIFFRTETRYTNVQGGFGIVVARNQTELRVATE